MGEGLTSLEAVSSCTQTWSVAVCLGVVVIGLIAPRHPYSSPAILGAMGSDC